MKTPSRTPEGESNQCPVCGKTVRLEPSSPANDAPCPYCGTLLWFDKANTEGEEPPRDPDSIGRTKQQIRTLVREIARISRSDLSPKEFHAEFLSRVVASLAAIGGAVWTVEEQGRLTLRYQINLQETKLRDSEEDQIRHGRLLQKIMEGGESMLIPPRSGAGDDTEAGNPTDFLLVLGPLKTELEVIGVIEIFQRPDAGPATQKGYLRFLEQMCDLAGDFFKSRQLRRFDDQ